MTTPNSVFNFDLAVTVTAGKPQVTVREKLPPPAVPFPLTPGDLGIDVSHHQPPIDWIKVKAAGYRFAYIRRTRGVDYVDVMGLPHWNGAKAAGLIVAGYHYFEHDRDGGEQAMAFSAALGEDVGHTTPAVDFETSGQPRLPLKPKAEITANLKKFLDTLAAVGLRPAVIYTNDGSVDAMTTRPAWLADYPLWLADWTPPMNVPAPWTFARFWQQGQRVVDGVTNPVDWNVFNGFTPTTVPPPTPGPVLFQVRIIVAALNVRSGPAATFTDIGDVLKDAVVSVYEERGGWFRISPAEQQWISGSLAYSERVVPTAPPPVVVPPPVPAPDTRGLVCERFSIDNLSVGPNEDCVFHFKVRNTSPVVVEYGCLAAHTDQGATAQSWTNEKLEPGQALEWTDHINLPTPRTVYQVYMGVCFSRANWMLPDSVWARLSPSIAVTVR